MPCSGGFDALFWLLEGTAHRCTYPHTDTLEDNLKKKKHEKKNPFVSHRLQRGLGSLIASSPVLTLLGHPLYQGHIGDTDSRI